MSKKPTYDELVQQVKELESFIDLNRQALNKGAVVEMRGTIQDVTRLKQADQPRQWRKGGEFLKKPSAMYWIQGPE